MQALILAGGLGTRLGRLTADRPKSLVEAGGRPFIDWQIDLLKEWGVRGIVLAVGHGADMIRDYLGGGESRGVNIAYSYDTAHAGGTGGAVIEALPMLGDMFCVMYGDSYPSLDFQKAWGFFEDSPYPAVMTVYKNRGLYDVSNAAVEGDRIVCYKKNTGQPFEYIDAGINFFKKQCFQGYGQGVIDLGQVFDDTIDRNSLGAFVTDQRFYEIGSRQGLMDFDDFVASGKSLIREYLS